MELLTRIDYYLLLFMHDHCIKWAKYLTPFSKVLSFIGKDGIVLFIIAAILMLFRKTRKIGICVFGAIGAGAILSKCIRESEDIAYDDLGTEAIRKLYVEDFPAIVVIDSEGNDLYETSVLEYKKE